MEFRCASPMQPLCQMAQWFTAVAEDTDDNLLLRGGHLLIAKEKKPAVPLSRWILGRQRRCLTR
jgi:hypothetical protein